MDEVRKYRDEAKEVILNVIDSIDAELNWESKMWAVVMGT